MKPILETQRVALDTITAGVGEPVEIEVRQMSARDFDRLSNAEDVKNSSTLVRAANMAMLAVIDWGELGTPADADEIMTCLPPGVLIEISDHILDLNGAAAAKNFETTAGVDSS